MTIERNKKKIPNCVHGSIFDESSNRMRDKKKACGVNFCESIKRGE